MMRKLIGGCLMLVILGWIRPTLAGDAAARPRWPLDLPTRYLTSGFMEYRPGRYHAGLDLKTQSRMGFAVHAAQDGCIVRVRATARAYGRAIYLQTPAGTTYVYAHLSRFSDRLRTRILAAQAASGNYRTELFFKAGELCVTRGEVLGLTGQSGTSGPHLHFEVRDRQQNPVNPLDQGFAVPDSLPPVIYAVHAVPMTPTATVEGKPAIMVFGNPDHVALPDTLPTLHITGPVAFTARIVDYGDLPGYRFEPGLLAVRLDGQEVYRAKNSTFSFAAVAKGRLEWYDGFSPRERWLYRRGGVDIPGRKGRPWPLGEGGQGLSPGAHELVLTAVDHAGGKATVVLPLIVGGVDVPGHTPWRPDPVQTSMDGDFALPDSCRLNPFFAEGLGAAGFTDIPLSSAHGDPVQQAISLWTRPWLLPGPALIQALAQHLEPLPFAVECLAGDWPIESAVPVTFPQGERSHPIPAATERPFCRVYRWDGTQWAESGSLMAGEGSGGQPDASWGFRLAKLGQYAVFADHTAPRLKTTGTPESPLVVRPGPQAAVKGVTPPYWEVFPLAYVEQGSGLDSGAITVILAGKSLVVEPDLPRDRLLVELPPETLPGRQQLEIGLQDICGNRSLSTVFLDCEADNK